MANLGGASKGYLDFVNQEQARQTQQAQMQAYLQQLAAMQANQKQQQEQYQRAQTARQGIPDVLAQMPQAGGQAPQLPQPPMPGQSSAPPPGAGGPPPGVGAPPSAPGMPPAAGGPPPAAASPNWQSIKDSIAGKAGGAVPGGAPQLPPPPAAGAPAAPAGGTPSPAGADGVMDKKELNVQTITQFVEALKKAGVPKDQWMDMIDQWKPHMDADAKRALDTYKAQNAALDAGIRAMSAALNAQSGARRAATGERAETNKEEERKSRIELNGAKKAKLERSLSGAGGAGAVKIVHWVHDENKVVLGGYDRAGHYHEVDEKPEGPGEKAGSVQHRKVSELQADLRIEQNAAKPDQKRISELKKQIADLEKGGKGGADKKTPTDADRAWVKAHPEDKAKFVANFGVEP